jgi:hypothetical protein
MMVHMFNVCLCYHPLINLLRAACSEFVCELLKPALAKQEAAHQLARANNAALVRLIKAAWRLCAWA